MNCLVTGGAGFIGSHLVDVLVESGHNVYVIDNLSSGTLDNVNKKVEFIEKSITDDLSAIFKAAKFDYVFHLAAQINLRRSCNEPCHDANTNIVGSLNIIENCYKNNVKKIIFSSTGGAIYHPSAELPFTELTTISPASPYGLSKKTVENYLKLTKELHGQEYTCLRYSNVYGPRQNPHGEAGVVAIFMEKLAKNEKLSVFGDGEQTRDYVYVKDVVNANIIGMNLNGIYNVSTGKETSVNSIARKVQSSMGKDANIEYLDPIPGEMIRSCLSSRRLQLRTGWKPTVNIDKGIEITSDWICQ